MRGRVDDLPPKPLPLRASQVRDDDGHGLPFRVLDFGGRAVIRLEMGHDRRRLVVHPVHLPRGCTMGHRHDPVVGKMRVAHKGRPAGNPPQKHARQRMRQISVAIGRQPFVVGQAQDQARRRVEQRDVRAHTVGEAEVGGPRLSGQLLDHP